MVPLERPSSYRGFESSFILMCEYCFPEGGVRIPLVIPEGCTYLA
ncbi:MAG TPA: hypothetical protein VFF30_07115 [Nitrososphaerales archaeon]|nr:hypothetical protein [Nitrososphaerales archaeon]